MNDFPNKIAEPPDFQPPVNVEVNSKLLEDLMWKTYNAQGENGGERDAMYEVLKELNIPDEVRVKLADHLGKQGFMTPVFVKDCMIQAVKMAGGVVREVT